MKRWGQKGPENYDRSDALKLLEAADNCVLSAFRQLAAAGMPRAAKPHRARNIEQATTAFDMARARLTDARYRFEACQRRLADRERDHRDEPHDRAAVTQLVPLVRESTIEVQELGRLLCGYRAGNMERSGLAEERRTADRLNSSFFGREDEQRHRCNWCGVVEKYGTHYPVDRDGFVVKRQQAVRFCCSGCFFSGADLKEPAPKALPPALPLEREPTPETVACVLGGLPQLPAAGRGDCHDPN